MIAWERVEELREDIGAEDFNEVLELFMDEVKVLLDELRTDPSPRDLEERMHFLKGSAFNIGFSAMGDLCRDAEVAAASGHPDPRALSQISRCFEASREELFTRA